MELNVQIVLVGVAFIGLIYFLFGSKKGLTIFELHFKQGRLDSHKGKVPEKFMREARGLAKKHKLTGVIRAEKKSGVRLHVSATINDDMTQRIRNIFPFELYEQNNNDSGKRSV